MIFFLDNQTPHKARDPPLAWQAAPKPAAAAGEEGTGEEAEEAEEQDEATKVKLLTELLERRQVCRVPTSFDCFFTNSNYRGMYDTELHQQPAQASRSSSIAA